MNTIRLTQEEFKTLVLEGLDEYEPIENGDWEVDSKWQHMECIVKSNATGKFYSYTLFRTGSPYSDYYYSCEDGGTELHEVELQEKTVVVKTWAAIKETNKEKSMNLDGMPQTEGESFLVYAQNYEEDGMVWHQVSWFEGNLYPEAMSYNVDYEDRIDVDSITAWVAVPQIKLEKE